MIRIMTYGEVPEAEILSRKAENSSVEGVVRDIIADVRANGDQAVAAYTERFDGIRPDPLFVTEAEIEAAVEAVGADFLGILKKAAANIRHFHSAQLRNSFILNDRPGIVMGQKVIPMDRVALYVPGGTAAYPSTVLMDAIPAKLAGVPELIMATPPRRDGSIHPAILAAAHTAGVDRILKCGGAQAIAALAYGTERIPKVDKIVGPGNAFVAEAKKQVYGTVAIDMIAGPSEILIVADADNDPAVLAADLLSQAEHDRMASAVLITDSTPLAEAVRDAIEAQLPLLAREEIARASIEQNGRIILVKNLVQAIDAANALAPEHLELAVADPFGMLDRVRHAGSVFLGRNTPEALGDYMAGPNHTLPTSGTARFSSPLSVDDFIKKMQYTYFTADALKATAADVAAFAMQEGLTAHARSALIRTEQKGELS